MSCVKNCECKDCEMLIDEHIKVVDKHYDNPFMNDLYHFEDGFKCLYTGIESLSINDLKK